MTGAIASADGANAVRSGTPSRTALWVATQRAAHQLLDEPVVFHDPVALSILGAAAEAALRRDPFRHNDPLSRSLRAAVVVRSRLVEDEIARAVAAGVRQYVVLGAGLDTFAYRDGFAGTGLRVFEVDHPSTQQWKRQLLLESGLPLPDGLTFAPVDFEHETLAQGLADAGFATDRPACFSWLGVTMYLTEAAVMEPLRFVAGLPRGSSITFDYQPAESLLNPIQRATTEVIRQRAAALGEPMITSFDPAVLRERLLVLGFGEVESWEPEDLNRRYLSRRKDGLYNNGGRLICVRV